MKKKIVPREMLLPIAMTLVCNYLAYFASRAITTNKYHYDVTMAWEEHIPFLPWTLLIYWGCYLFWVVNYVIAARGEKSSAWRFYCADFAAKCVCLLVYVLFPTTNVRPAVEGSGIFDAGMRLLYQIDAPDNLFPSIHCLTSWFCFIAVRKEERIPRWYRWTSLGLALAICLSTLTTKQHALVDVFGGILLAEASYFLVHKVRLDLVYERGLGRFGKKD